MIFCLSVVSVVSGLKVGLLCILGSARTEIMVLTTLKWRIAAG